VQAGLFSFDLILLFSRPVPWFGFVSAAFAFAFGAIAFRLFTGCWVYTIQPCLTPELFFGGLFLYGRT
jgi:hypothetical protein